MNIEKIIQFVQSSNYEQMHTSGAKVQLLRQVIGEYQSFLGLKDLSGQSKMLLANSLQLKSTI
ncbi:hypothetical protein [Paenibacillus terrae]|uniref:hypothetical protein n=1 Tax=Paenibacillus terrae TaxID=159743 RepID=UPI0011EB4B67|nr:hypothetical protein [Paenibacillus terrae]